MTIADVVNDLVRQAKETVTMSEREEKFLRLGIVTGAFGMADDGSRMEHDAEVEMDRLFNELTDKK